MRATILRCGPGPGQRRDIWKAAARCWVFYRLRTIRISGQIDPGDALAIYSDGVTEAANAKDEEFGEERWAH